MNEDAVNELLNTHSTKKYSITYGGFRANHISHGIVALYKIGASKTTIEDYIDYYSKELESPEKHLHLPERQDPKDFDFSSILGKRVSFYPIFDYYEDIFERECNGSMELFIINCFLSKADGMLGAALHPLIHMGYGYVMRNPKLVVEGMAFLHHSYIAFDMKEINSVDLGQGKEDILDILDEVRENQTLREMMIEKASEENALFVSLKDTLSLFGRKCLVLCHYASGDIMSYVSRIKLPSWFNVASTSVDDVLKLIDWIIDCTIVVYQAAEKRNDFFLLHGVTSAWGLRQVLSCIGDKHIPDAIICIKIFLCCLTAVYIVQDTPAIKRNFLTESTEKSWNDIISEAKEVSRDTHVYKLIQVCLERSVKNSSEDILFRAAANTSLTYPF